MPSGSPTREQADLAEVLEMVLDKGIVINADVAVTVGQTELLGIEIRAAIASFETAAKYGLAFPSGTDMRRVEQASGRQSLEGEDVEPVDLGIEASSGGSEAGDADDADQSSSAAPGRRPTPTVMAGDVGDEVSDEEAGEDGEGGESESEDGDATGDGDSGSDGSDDADDPDDRDADADGGGA